MKVDLRLLHTENPPVGKKALNDNRKYLAYAKADIERTNRHIRALVSESKGEHVLHIGVFYCADVDRIVDTESLQPGIHSLNERAIPKKKIRHSLAGFANFLHEVPGEYVVPFRVLSQWAQIE